MNTQEAIVQTFGNQLRLRVCGLLIQNDRCLMIQHKSINESQAFFSPPGGGLKYGETIESRLKAEFLEETGLEIEVEKFLFFNEFLAPPLHAIELFFQVKQQSGELSKGFDPELATDNQIIEELHLFSLLEIQKISVNSRHQFFDFGANWEDILSLQGHFKKDF